MNIVIGAMGSDAFLRIETCTLRVAGVKTLALEPIKPLIQPAVSAYKLGDLINRLLQALAYILKLTIYIPRSDIELGDVGFKGLNLLIVIVDFSFYLLEGRNVTSELDGLRDVRTLLLYIVFIFPFAFYNMLLLLTVFRPVFANRDLFGYTRKRLRIRGKRVRHIRAARAVVV